MAEFIGRWNAKLSDAFRWKGGSWRRPKKEDKWFRVLGWIYFTIFVGAIAYSKLNQGWYEPNGENNGIGRYM